MVVRRSEGQVKWHLAQTSDLVSVSPGLRMMLNLRSEAFTSSLDGLSLSRIRESVCARQPRYLWWITLYAGHLTYQGEPAIV